MHKYSVTVAGHQTSISLEKEFWLGIKKIAREKNIPLNKLISMIDKKQPSILSFADKGGDEKFIVIDGPHRPRYLKRQPN